MKMTTKNAMAIIDGLRVEIEPSSDGEGMDCTISKGRFSASLACLEDTAMLFNHTTGEEWGPVPERTIERIAHWAMDRGY